MRKKKKLRVSPAFWIAAVIVAVIISFALIIPGVFEQVTGTVRSVITHNSGWFYLLTIMMLVGVSLYLILSPVGKIRLGDPDSRPEYGTFSWIAMLFSAGMGIGLVFYGAAEPLSHFAVQAPEAAEFSQEALHDAFKYSFLHYGIHAWAIYAVVALALAYFQFRKKERTLLSVTLKPLFGRVVDGKLGYVIDSVTIFATVVGVGIPVWVPEPCRSMAVSIHCSAYRNRLSCSWSLSPLQPSSFWVRPCRDWTGASRCFPMPI